MGQVHIRNLDDTVIAALRARARQCGESLEQHLRRILTEAARPDKHETWAQIDALREEIGRVGLNATNLIREDRDSR